MCFFSTDSDMFQLESTRSKLNSNISNQKDQHPQLISTYLNSLNGSSLCTLGASQCGARGASGTPGHPRSCSSSTGDMMESSGQQWKASNNCLHHCPSHLGSQGAGGLHPASHPMSRPSLGRACRDCRVLPSA